MAEAKEDTAKETKPSSDKLIVYGSIGFALLVLVLIMFSCGPKKGTMMFGICRTFLEFQVSYPETIDHILVEQYERAVRIYFTQIDAFGEYKQQTMECAYKQDPQRGWILDIVLLNRQKVDPEKVKEFNSSLSAVIAAEPDLTLPPPISSDIRKIR